jgi:hypothetical protein
MNIGNMPEEELDDLFRKSASEFHPEYDPAAWEAMEKKLEAYKAPTSFWKRLSWLTALLLILGLGFWMSVRWLQNKEESRGLPFPAAAPSTYPAAQPNETGLNRKPTTPARSQTAAIANAGRTTPQTAPMPGGEIPPTTPVPGGGRQQVSALQQDRNNQLPADPRGRGAGRFLPPVGSRVVIKSALPGPDTLYLDGQQAPGTGMNLHANPPAANPAPTLPAVILPAPPLHGTDTLTLAAALPADSSAAAGQQAGPVRSRLGLRLLLAPDLSTVGFSRPDEISTNIGLELSYQLSPRWRLATGLLKARKVYAAEAGDYGKDGFWYNRTLPDDINAVCQVLDIPLNIGYQVFARGKSAVTLNTGLSSYVMLSEAYDYYYQGGYGMPYTKTWEVRNQNRHLFSIYNLSALYSHRLTPSMAWGIEPFIKVPLAGVGAGRVKLASGGIFFSLGYRFP